MSLDKPSGWQQVPEQPPEPEFKKLLAESGFDLVIPDRSEKFEGPTHYSGFTKLPGYKRKINTAVMVCQHLVNDGVFIFDEFGRDHDARRHVQNTLRDNIRRKYGDKYAGEYSKLRNDNFLRAGGLFQTMMVSVLDTIGNAVVDIDTPQAKRASELIARFPKIRANLVDGSNSGVPTYTVSDPKFQWMIDMIVDIHLGPDQAMGATESTPYHLMTNEQKLVLLNLLNEIAHDFLRLVINGDYSDAQLVPVSEPGPAA